MSDKIETEVAESIGQFQRKAFIDVVSQKPETTIQDLYVLGEKYDLMDVTLGELMGKPRAPQKKRRIKKQPDGAVPVRTKAERDAYDGRVFEIVRDANGSYVSAQQVRDRIGGTPLQVRKALNRLIDSGRIEFTGRARATRYNVQVEASE